MPRLQTRWTVPLDEERGNVLFLGIGVQARHTSRDDFIRVRFPLLSHSRAEHVAARGQRGPKPPVPLPRRELFAARSARLFLQPPMLSRSPSGPIPPMSRLDMSRNVMPALPSPSTRILCARSIIRTAIVAVCPSASANLKLLAWLPPSAPSSAQRLKAAPTSSAQRGYGCLHGHLHHKSPGKSRRVRLTCSPRRHP